MSVDTEMTTWLYAGRLVDHAYGLQRNAVRPLVDQGSVEVWAYVAWVELVDNLWETVWAGLTGMTGATSW